VSSDAPSPDVQITDALAFAARERLVAALRRLGVGPGRVVYLGLDLAGLALPRWPRPTDAAAMRARRAEVCAFVHDAVREAVGESGTLLVPTFSYDYARRGAPYDHESSPAELGPFPEWYRRREGVIRSLHPLFSVAGKGPRAAAILERTGRSAFGVTSPFGRLTAEDALFVSLGVTMARWLTFAHHLEQIAGVNYAYNKAFTQPVRRGGVEVPGPFLAFVRYLGAGVDIALDGLEGAVREAGALLEDHGEAGLLQTASARDVERIGLEMLARNPFAFIKTPVVVHVDGGGGREQPDAAAANVRLGRLAI
jgi:aminoglycoside 3-N-acetyltransferase